MSGAFLLGFPVEWAALALFTAAAIYWERSGWTGLGVEGCVLSAMLGLAVTYEWTGDYALAAAVAAAAALLFALLTGGLIELLGADPAVGAFAASLVPACGLGLLTRAHPLRLLTERPAPGLVVGSPLAGTPAEEIFANPWLVATPIVLLAAAFLLLRTPFGLRLRAYGETPAFAMGGRRRVFLHRWAGAAIGALCAVPGAALLLRAHGGAPPLALGYIGLACAVAGRWSFAAGLLLAAGPALARAAMPLAPAAGAGRVLLVALPFLIAAGYLALLSRRALRASATRQSHLDPDVL
jgi:simple sugar transport system permease protein